MRANIKSIRKAVASAGTAVALVASKTNAEGAIIKADDDNTGSIYVGASDVSSSNGFRLKPGQAANLSDIFIRGTNCQYDLSQIYVDADTSADHVDVLYQYGTAS